MDSSNIKLKDAGPLDLLCKLRARSRHAALIFTRLGGNTFAIFYRTACTSSMSITHWPVVYASQALQPSPRPSKVSLYSSLIFDRYQDPTDLGSPEEEEGHAPLQAPQNGGDGLPFRSDDAQKDFRRARILHRHFSFSVLD